MATADESKLEKIYKTPGEPAGFTGSAAFLNKEAQRPPKKLPDTKEWLAGEEAYSLHKPIRRNFQRSQVRVGNIDEQWQADLSDMQDVKHKKKVLPLC